MRTVIKQCSHNIRQFESIKKRTLRTHNLLSNNIHESDRLRECKNEETDNAKRGKQNTNISENGARNVI